MSEQVTSIPVADVLAVDAAVTRSTGSGEFGITAEGFVPKPFARLLAEKLALARALFGDDLDLGSGSAIRKLLELTALEDMRTWAALAAMSDNLYVSTAVGDALSRLGEELGLSRPYEQARGKIKLKLTGTLDPGEEKLVLRSGTRLLTPGGHHVSLDETVTLSPENKERDAAVVAFYPGPSHDLDPSFTDSGGGHPQKIDRFNRLDPAAERVIAAEDAGTPLVSIEHTAPLTGGARQWPDLRYRELLLNAPRSVWTVDAIRIAVSLVPGVRQVIIRDGFGGLDINQSIFGNFNFIERVFGTERDLGSPYYFTVLVAPTSAAIWEGPDGLKAAVESVIDDLRPIGIFPRVEKAEEIGIGVEAKLVVRGLPLPTGSRQSVNASQAAIDLKERIVSRLRTYVDTLQVGDPVRYSEIVWSVMNEPGIADALELRLLRYPAGIDSIDFGAGTGETAERFQVGQNVALQSNQIAVFVDDIAGLEIV